MTRPASTTEPLFQQIAQTLRQRLRDGSYPVGIPLPGERELTREFGVARSTVRAALARLQEEGCITRLRTVVVDPSIVNEKALKTAGAFGVLSAGSVLQVIVGGEADGLAMDINDIIG